MIASAETTKFELNSAGELTYRFTDELFGYLRLNGTTVFDLYLRLKRPGVTSLVPVAEVALLIDQPPERWPVKSLHQQWADKVPVALRDPGAQRQFAADAVLGEDLGQLEAYRRFAASFSRVECLAAAIEIGEADASQEYAEALAQHEELARRLGPLARRLADEAGFSTPPEPPQPVRDSAIS